MTAIKITIEEQIYIEKSPEIVWDFTQDFSRRAHWDRSVLEAVVISELPDKIVKIKTKGSLTATLIYKLNDRPRKTSLVMTDVTAALITGGGGSWTYEKKDNGTLWTQTNTLILVEGSVMKFLVPVFRWKLRSNTISAMKLAKKILEK